MDIKERVAPSADKMGMGFDMTIEPVCPVGRNFENLAELRQERKVAVDGAEADIRKFFFDMQIDGICGGVIVAGQQEAFDGLSLAAVF